MNTDDNMGNGVQFFDTHPINEQQIDLDGRTGPTTMNGKQLDIALMRLNSHLQARYAQDEILNHLDVVPAQDFATVATATAQSPPEARVAEKGEFGFAVSDGASLALHMAEQYSSR